MFLLRIRTICKIALPLFFRPFTLQKSNDRPKEKIQPTVYSPSQLCPAHRCSRLVRKQNPVPHRPVKSLLL